MKTRRCGQCGSLELLKITQTNVMWPWRDYPMVPLVRPPDGLCCKKCGELIFSAAHMKALDALTEESITIHVNNFIGKILLRENCDQKSLASHLGVSPEYLSEIKSGRKIPKFQTFNFLKTLALDPRSFEVSHPNFKDWKIA